MTSRALNSGGSGSERPREWYTRVIIYLQGLFLREACRPTCFCRDIKSIEKYTRVKSTVREYDHRARFTAAESPPNGTLIQHQYGGRTPTVFATRGSPGRPRRLQLFRNFLFNIYRRLKLPGNCNSFEASASRIARLHERENLEFQECGSETGSVISVSLICTNFFLQHIIPLSSFMQLLGLTVFI